MDLSSVKKNFALITNIVKDRYISRKEQQVGRWLNGDLFIKIQFHFHGHFFSGFYKSLLCVMF